MVLQKQPSLQRCLFIDPSFIVQGHYLVCFTVSPYKCHNCRCLFAVKFLVDMSVVTLVLSSKVGNIVVTSSYGLSRGCWPRGSWSWSCKTVSLNACVYACVAGISLVLLAVARQRSLRTLSNSVIASLAFADFLLAGLVVPLGVYQLVSPPPVSDHRLRSQYLGV